MSIKNLAPFILICCYLVAPAFAADLQGSNPGSIQKHSGDVQEYYRLKKMLKEKTKPVEESQIDDETVTSKQDRPQNDIRITVNKIVIDTSEILSKEELRAITTRYEGGEQTIYALFEVVDKINVLYRDKGFITAKALLPPQKVEAGVVKIRLIEGRVGQVLVEGNEFTRDSFFLRSLSLNSGDLVRLDQLKDDLNYFNAVNDVSMRVTLRAGTQSGETDLILRAMEPPNFEIALLADNAGTKSVGEERVGLRFGSSSLLGYRDSLSLSGYLTEGSDTFSIAYGFPINRFGTRISAGYGYNQVDIKSGPFADLDVGGDSYNYNVTLNHPLVFDPDMTTNIFGGYQFNNSTTDFSGVTIAQTKVDKVPFGFDFKRIDEYGLWYCRNTFTYGRERQSSTNDFLRYNLDLVRTFALPSNYFAIIRGQGQLADHHPLASTEQFQVGGLSSVRGYPEGHLVGDEGYFIGAEVKFPLPVNDLNLFGFALYESLKGSIFVDHGAAFPYRSGSISNGHEDYITGAGVGLTLNFSRFLSGKIDIAVPLAKHGTDIDSVQLHFTLQSIVF